MPRLEAELAAPSPLGEVPGLEGDLGQRLGVAIPEDGGDEAFVEGDGDADVRTVEDADGLALELGIDARILEEGQRAGLDDQVGDGDLGLPLERVEIGAEGPGAVHGDFRGDVEVRDRSLRQGHALGDDGAHGGQGLVFEFGARARRDHEGGTRGGRGSRHGGTGDRLRGGGGGGGPLDVPPDDATARARSLNEPEIHA
jgi:hypothetical protein